MQTMIGGFSLLFIGVLAPFLPQSMVVRSEGVARLAILESSRAGSPSCTTWRVEGTDLYITAAHCTGKWSLKIQHPKTFSQNMIAEQGGIVPTVLEVLPSADVAILRGAQGPGFSIAIREPVPGTDIIALGFAETGGGDIELDDSLMVTKGIASGLRGLEEQKFGMIWYEGFSGGPLLDSSGSVVGIVSYGYQITGGWINTSPRLITIQRLVEKWRQVSK